MKVVSFHILEHVDGGVADVFLSHGTVSDLELDLWDDELELSLDDESPEFEFERYKQKLFTVVNNTFVQGRGIGTDSSDLYYVINKDRPEITDYYSMVQRYIQEYCEFIDQDYAIYFKVNSL